jgi:hypothetical protein
MNPVKPVQRDPSQSVVPTKSQELHALTQGGVPRAVEIGVPSGDLRISGKTAGVVFQSLGKRSIQASEDAWSIVNACINEIGIDPREWADLGSRAEQAEVLLDAIEVMFAEEGLESEFATVTLRVLEALTCALQVNEEDSQEINLARAAALLGDIARDFGDEMNTVQAGYLLQAASNIYTNKSADASVCRFGAALLANIADRCEWTERPNHHAVLLKMLEHPPSRLKGDADFLKEHARAISVASAALQGLEDPEIKSLLNGIATLIKRSTDEGVREACLEALENLESFSEPTGTLVVEIQTLAERLEKLLS